MDIVRALIAVLVFFVAGSVFAGDRYRTDGKTQSAIELCTNGRTDIATPCALKAAPCPAQQDGGVCIDVAQGTITYQNWSIAGQVTWYYCANSKPTWNGSSCILQDPCSVKSGQAVDDGSVDFGDGANKKLSLSFPSLGDDGNYVGQTFCSGGCKAAVTKEVGAMGIGMGGRYYNTFNASFSGQSCDPPAIPVGPNTTPVKLVQKTSKEYDCLSAGKGYGYVNNVVVCVEPDKKGGKAQQTTQKKNSDGTTTKTVVDKAVSCTGDGACSTITTTTTTVYNSDGTQKSTSQDKTTETEQGKGNGASGSTFCKENPSSAICKSGTFSGSCDAVPACDGDPILCATAKAAFEMKCVVAAKTDGSTLADQMVTGNDPALQGENNPLIPKSVTLSSITPTRTLSGACPPPITVSLFGQTASYSFDAVCPWIETLGRILVGLAWLTAFFIVSRSIK